MAYDPWFRLVIAQKSKLRLTQEVTAALASHSREHRLTASSFFPCSIDGEYLYGYAGDGYRSPLWLCVFYNGSPVLVQRLRGSKMYFHQATKDRRILLIPGILFLWSAPVAFRRVALDCSSQAYTILTHIDCNHYCYKLLHCKYT